MSVRLLEAYHQMYADTLSEAEAPKPRRDSPEARAAAAKRLEALKKDPKNSSYSRNPDRKKGMFGKYVDAWAQDPRADAEFERMNRPDVVYRPKFDKKNEDLYQDLTSYLVDEGYADAIENAEVLYEHMSDEWIEVILTEMRKEDKVAGKPKGGSSDLAYRAIKQSIRAAGGSPGRQTKKVPGQKPPTGEAALQRRAQARAYYKDPKVKARREQESMHSRYD